MTDIIRRNRRATARAEIAVPPGHAGGNGTSVMLDAGPGPGEGPVAGYFAAGVSPEVVRACSSRCAPCES